MVYETGFSTRRTYSARPVVTSYAVSMHKTNYLRYPSYFNPTKVYTGEHIITAPIRVITSPISTKSQILPSPGIAPNINTTSRVIFSPVKTTSWYYIAPSSSTAYDSYRSYTNPIYYCTPLQCVRSRSLSPSLRPITPSIRSVPSNAKKYDVRVLTNCNNSDPYEDFKNETSRIRNKAHSLIRDIHTPVIRRARSCTPFPISGYAFEPTSKLALEAYVERITNPIRHVAKEVHRMVNYLQPIRKYIGKSHLASVRICGDKAYNIRRPLYDSDKVRSDINILSWYLRCPEKTVIAEKENLAIRDDTELDPYRPSRKFFLSADSDKLPISNCENIMDSQNGTKLISSEDFEHKNKLLNENLFSRKKANKKDEAKGKFDENTKKRSSETADLDASSKYKCEKNTEKIQDNSRKVASCEFGEKDIVSKQIVKTGLHARKTPSTNDDLLQDNFSGGQLFGKALLPEADYAFEEAKEKLLRDKETCSVANTESNEVAQEPRPLYEHTAIESVESKITSQDVHEPPESYCLLDDTKPSLDTAEI